MLKVKKKHPEICVILVMRHFYFPNGVIFEVMYEEMMHTLYHFNTLLNITDNAISERNKTQGALSKFYS